MIIYFIIFILLILTRFLKNKNFWCFFILFIFSAIRFDVGADFPIYYSLAERKEFINLSLLRDRILFPANIERVFFEYYRFEILNKIIYKIVWFFDFPQLVVIIYSFFNLFFIKKGLELKKINSNIPWIIFYVFPIYYFFYLSIFRQGIAVGICFFAFKYLKKDNFIKFFSLVLIATLFHKASCIFLFSYFIKDLKLNNKLGFLIFFTSFFSEKIIKKIISLTGMYTHYLDDSNFIQSGSKFIYIIIFIYIFILFFSYMNINFYIKNKKIINICFLGSFLYISLSSLGITGVRISIYFLIYFIYICNDLLKNFKPILLSELITWFLCFFLLIISLKIDISKAKDEVQFVPYKVFFIKNQKVFRD